MNLYFILRFYLTGGFIDCSSIKIANFHYEKNKLEGYLAITRTFIKNKREFSNNVVILCQPETHNTKLVYQQ